MASWIAQLKKVAGNRVRERGSEWSPGLDSNLGLLLLQPLYIEHLLYQLS